MQQAPESSSWHSRAWHHHSLPLHSSVQLTISGSQQIVDGGLSSVCLGPDNCQLADTQHPMPTVLVSSFQMQYLLGIIPHTAVRSPKGWEVILNPPYFRTSLQTINTPFQYPHFANHWFTRQNRCNDQFLPTERGTAVHTCPDYSAAYLNHILI